MDEKELQLEEKHLNLTKDVILAQLKNANILSGKLKKAFDDDNSTYLEEMRTMNLNEMSGDVESELDFKQRSLTNLTNEIDDNVKLISIYKNMLNNPYFARLDIDIDKEIEKYYIGIHNLVDKDNKFWVLDWRSPIAGLFYDYEVGHAEIKTDEMKTPCELLNKRQYSIENGKLIYFFDTNIAIDDDILKSALAKSSTTKMKTIVQTIQKEQNEIIRGNENISLLVQGIAGSGKTAIALHRIAYLLYKMKNKINSDNIAMLSPNNAFSTYISSVLPDLAEDDIKKFQLDYVLKDELKKVGKIEEKCEQIERVIKNGGKYYSYKTSYDFYNKLKNYCNETVSSSFNCEDFYYMGLNFQGKAINNLYYKSYANKDVFTRICWICEYLIAEYFYKVSNPFKLKTIKNELFNRLYSMLKSKSCVKLYIDFLAKQNLTLHLFNGKIKNEDAYAILYIRWHMFGAKKFDDIKHLIIDEIQDYSPIQIDLISKMFDCPKTMLGDFRQSVLPLDFENKLKEFNCIFNEDIKGISLDKTYRPTVEIAKLFNHIADIKQINVVDRHGDKPICYFINERNMSSFILDEVNKLKEKYKSIAIITKTSLQARKLYNIIKGKLDLQLIDDSKDAYNNSVCLLSSFCSKGMEFDAVIIFDCSEDNYNNEIDYNLLYIATSRALHKLEFIVKDKLPDKLKNYTDLDRGEIK